MSLLCCISPGILLFQSVLYWLAIESSTWVGKRLRHQLLDQLVCLQSETKEKNRANVPCQQLPFELKFGTERNPTLIYIIHATYTKYVPSSKFANVCSKTHTLLPLCLLRKDSTSSTLLPQRTRVKTWPVSAILPIGTCLFFSRLCQ